MRISRFWFIGGLTPRSREVRRSKKKKKIGFSKKPDFPDPDPDFRISVHGIANGAPRATCSQNFRPLAAVVSEMLMAFEVDNNILDLHESAVNHPFSPTIERIHEYSNKRWNFCKYL